MDDSYNHSCSCGYNRYSRIPCKKIQGKAS
ncbi:MAG: SWIM zinc finger family protein [Christensenellales bacterium]